jgi:hypothetical protein
MLVKSFGCSFVFGTDLSDQVANKPSQLTWPAVFSQQQGHYYCCHAYGGSGNLVIANRVLKEIALDVTALFIVGWTWIDRFDYIDTNQNWSTIRPGSPDDLAKTYYRELHSETRDKLTSLMTIRTVIDSLRERDFPFIMTYMDELLFDRAYNTSPAIRALQDYVKPYMTQFEGQTFLDWSRNRGYPESDNWHPLEQAHAAGAEVIQQAFDKQSTNDHWHHA